MTLPLNPPTESDENQLPPASIRRDHKLLSSSAPTISDENHHAAFGVPMSFPLNCACTSDETQQVFPLDMGLLDAIMVFQVPVVP